MSAAPALVICAHGTRSSAGRAAIGRVVAQVSEALPGVPVRTAFVDVQKPEVASVVDALPTRSGPGPSAVVVPLLLAAGYHVRFDSAQAVAGRADVAATAALGPDDRLVDLVQDRLGEVAAPSNTVVILAPAGSSDARAQADSAEMARRLSERLGTAVRLAYAAGPQPSVADAVAAARSEDAPHVTVASYLLAPGLFQRRIEDSGAHVVSGPLLPDTRIADVVIDRYRTATAAFTPGPSAPPR